MDKAEFAKYLRDRGYNAEYVEKCVLVMVPKLSKKIEAEINEIVKEVGFVGSYGWSEIRKK